MAGGELRLKDEEIEAFRVALGDVVDHALVKGKTYALLNQQAYSALYVVDFEKTREKIERHFGGVGIYSLVASFLTFLVSYNYEADWSEDDTRLLDLPKFSDRERLINDLVDQLRRPIRNYTFVWPTPPPVSETLASILKTSLRAGTASILLPDATTELPRVHPSDIQDGRLFTSKAGGAWNALMGDARASVLQEGVAIAVFENGWYGEFCGDIYEDVCDRVGAVYALLDIFGFLKKGVQPRFLNPFVIVYANSDKGFAPFFTPEKREDILALERSQETVKNPEPLSDTLSFAEAFQAVFQPYDEAKNLVSALFWYFKMSGGRSKSEKVLDAAICLEILAGERTDKDDPGIQSLIANRVAYALSHDMAERTYTRSRLKDFYALRSRIVHSGKRRITASEDTLLFQAVDLCRKMLLLEIEMLTRSVKPLQAELP